MAPNAMLSLFRGLEQINGDFSEIKINVFKRIGSGSRKSFKGLLFGDSLRGFKIRFNDTLSILSSFQIFC